MRYTLYVTHTGIPYTVYDILYTVYIPYSMYTVQYTVRYTIHSSVYVRVLFPNVYIESVAIAAPPIRNKNFNIFVHTSVPHTDLYIALIEYLK